MDLYGRATLDGVLEAGLEMRARPSDRWTLAARAFGGRDPDLGWYGGALGALSYTW